MEEEAVTEEINTSEQEGDDVVNTESEAFQADRTSKDDGEPNEGQVPVVDKEREAIEKAKAGTPVWFQKKMDKLTYDIRERDRKLADLEQAYAKIQAAQVQTKREPVAKPNIDNFETNEDYTEALLDWKIAETNSKREEQAAIQMEMSKQAEINGKFEEKRSKTMDKGFEKYDDFHSVVCGMPASIMTETVAKAIVETSNSEDVAYFLGNNLSEAQRIANMSPIQLAIEIGSISTKLKNKPKIKESSASDPIKTVSGTKSSVDKLPSEMTDKEYTKYRRERVAKRRNR